LPEFLAGICLERNYATAEGATVKLGVGAESFFKRGDGLVNDSLVETGSGLAVEA